jgi:hypothetical protein
VLGLYYITLFNRNMKSQSVEKKRSASSDIKGAKKA